MRLLFWICYVVAVGVAYWYLWTFVAPIVRHVFYLLP